ncbi:hypothetical protein IAU59_002512 [Kwoniella sp. CBS 9459]
MPDSKYQYSYRAFPPQSSSQVRTHVLSTGETYTEKQLPNGNYEGTLNGTPAWEYSKTAARDKIAMFIPVESSKGTNATLQVSAPALLDRRRTPGASRDLWLACTQSVEQDRADTVEHRQTILTGVKSLFAFENIDDDEATEITQGVMSKIGTFARLHDELGVVAQA